MESTLSCPDFLAHPHRYIIHRKDGLIHVILVMEKGGTKRPAATAGPAIRTGYA